MHKHEQKKPSVHWISHRGYHIQFVENSKKAFEAACAGGFTHLETDLRTTRDGVLVLCHDPDLSRVGGPKKPVSEMESAELRRITLSDQSTVLTFEEFYQHFGQRCQVTLDIKPEGGMRTVEKFLAWVKAARAEEWVTTKVTFLFWKAAHEAVVKKIFPQAQYYARREECMRAGLALLLGLPALGGIHAGRTYAMPPAFLGKSLFQAHYIAPFHARKARIVAFLPRDEAEARAAMAAGIDEILTNGEIFY
jgi:glycerophosphoryl diester phosphodiesterase